jgi:hypothetical protein
VGQLCKQTRAHSTHVLFACCCHRLRKKLRDQAFAESQKAGGKA